VAELVFVTVFHTYMCRNKLTTRQKFKKPNAFRQANAKKYNCVRTFVGNVKPVLHFA